MANSAARIFLKKGKSFPQLLGSRLVGRPRPSSILVTKDQVQLLAQPLINQNPTQQRQWLYLQRPALGDGFNFVDFVLGSKEAREGKIRLVSRRDKDEDDDGESDDFDYEEDDEPFDDDSDQYSGDYEYYNRANDDEDDDTDIDGQ